ncbi:carboxypeptidase regulatory-like domain-containing protein [Taibaiella koreensis]|uniref:carboxypeptidase regulatory-like domain-containing protein n=1 Tax=Taibaiella koreensis TaxID=1268548 RepID=UPI000E59CD9C|nr:carboxypeptidase regulatory-like domain-containing protein [Taibaiella koreensis]
MTQQMHRPGLVLLLLIILSSGKLSGQTTTGNFQQSERQGRTIVIKGNISDALTQKPVPGVKLSITNSSFQKVGEVQNDSAGNYSILISVQSGDQKLHTSLQRSDTTGAFDRILIDRDITINATDKVYTEDFLRCPVEKMGQDTPEDRVGPIHIGKAKVAAEYARNSPRMLPAFPGGNEQLRSFLMKKIHYRRNMKEAEIKGEVQAGFLIDTAGKMSDILVFRDLGAGSGIELINAFKAFPQWKPYEINGRKVPYFMLLSVHYDE